jgi:hypothetical protein
MKLKQVEGWVLFTVAILGCFIGPFISNSTITKGDQPHTMRLASILGDFLFLVVGWFGIASVPNFEAICGFTIVRCIGEAIIWMNATLLLQVTIYFYLRSTFGSSL